MTKVEDVEFLKILDLILIIMHVMLGTLWKGHPPSLKRLNPQPLAEHRNPHLRGRVGVLVAVLSRDPKLRES